MHARMASWVVAALAAVALTAQAATEIVVEYAIPDLFKAVHEEIAREFMKQRPDIKVTFRAPQPGYEEAAQQVLREAITNQLPDVSYQGLNRQRVFVDRKLAVDLTPFIMSEKDWNSLGYSDALLDLGRFHGRQYGVGFSLSTPIVYYNADLVRKAGGNPDSLPTNWTDILALANRIKALGGDVQGFHFDWDITGNWMFQALVFANGGSMLTPDEKTVAFSGAAGEGAMKLLATMVTTGTMRDVSGSVSLQDFIAGRLGIWSHSTSRLGGVMRQVGGKFDVRTGVFPVPAANGRLPAGGNVAMMFAATPERQKAAWDYIKFATGPLGATIMVKGTGYFPANTLPAGDPRLLADYYRQNPNHLTAIRQLDKVTNWYAFPGENGLKITDVIKDSLQSVVNKSTPPEAALKKVAGDVQALLPR